ncbi:rhodanese-like domain-containing protein [Denitratimonas sp. CY0512]|uniref:rhodanese-like domain-containing protein n=1 Tax=Denitratimonas sp. CY0512 TaxID=3131940 RepID=UPI003095E067
MIALLKTLFGFGGEQVSVQQAVQRINAGALLLDVREPGEFNAGHALDAQPLPLDRIRAQRHAALDALPAHNGELLLLCHSGVRSRLAQNLLGQRQDCRCINVRGGMAAWAAAGLPMSRATSS